MTIPQEPFDSLKERTRRVLMDNRQQMGTRSFVLPPLGVAPLGVADAGSEGLEAADLGMTGMGAVEAETAATGSGTLDRAGIGSATFASVPSESEAHAQEEGHEQEESQERPAPGSTDYLDLIRLRMWAIRTVRDLYPKQVCAAQRVRELSRNLAGTAGDSVHYRVILDKLKEAHEEWLALEERLWQANDAIRSTQWLVELLAEPVLHGHSE